MNSLQLILFLSSIVLTINGQWYIKKTYQTKFMNYPNPGKRNVPDNEIDPSRIICSKSYSQLVSYQDKMTWIFTCLYRQSTLSSDLNNIEINEYLPRITKVPKYRSIFYSPQDGNLFNRKSSRLDEDGTDEEK